MSNKTDIELLEQHEFSNMVLDVLTHDLDYIASFLEIIHLYLTLSKKMFQFVTYLKDAFKNRHHYTDFDLIEEIVMYMNKLDIDLVRVYSILGVSLYHYSSQITLFAEAIGQLHQVLEVEKEHNFDALIETFDDTLYVLYQRIELLEQLIPSLEASR